jgi:hypothetical protein
MNTKIRWAIVATVASFALLSTSAALACGGEEGASHGPPTPEKRAERFKKHDTNKDGFLTSNEVGNGRWEHLKVADANKDGKVSLAEMEQARKDGKLKKPHRNQNGNSKNKSS